jgi:threonine/homoserine/homoserine lactone efflux protein
VASLVLRGFLLGFAIAASPGPIFFLCLKRTLARGWLQGLVSGLGVATADAFYAALAAFGVGAVTSLLVGEKRWFALTGGAVLVALGFRIALERGRAAHAEPDRNGAGYAVAYLSTLGLTIANPSTIISFAALVAALGIGISAGLLGPSLIVLGVFLGSVTWWCVLALLGTVLRARVTPGVVGGISLLSGIAITALGMAAVVSAIMG